MTCVVCGARCKTVLCRTCSKIDTKNRAERKRYFEKRRKEVKVIKC